jgi:hypothetical protein
MVHSNVWKLEKIWLSGTLIIIRKPKVWRTNEHEDPYIPPTLVERGYKNIYQQNQYRTRKYIICILNIFPFISPSDIVSISELKMISVMLNTLWHYQKKPQWSLDIHYHSLSNWICCNNVCLHLHNCCYYMYNNDFNLIIVFNATFSNISAISWRPVLVVEEAGVPRENHQPWASNCIIRSQYNRVAQV